MNDEQFRAIRGLLVTIVILLGLIAGILLASVRLAAAEAEITHGFTARFRDAVLAPWLS
jgi:hypothetical protein